MKRFLEAPLFELGEQIPEAVAFRFCGDELTYSELAHAANRIANWLVSIGIGPGSRVGIYMDKCLDMPVAVYGILKSGAAYVPLDTGAPTARTAGIIDDCGIRVLIGSKAKENTIDVLCQQASSVEHVVGAEVEGASCHPIDISVPDMPDHQNRSFDDPAYILFTSGSTGVPKGIVHTHRSGISYVEMAAGIYDLQSTDRMGNLSPLHFDMSLLEFFGGISRGACIILVPEMIMKLPASLSKLIEEERITTWYSVPFALIQMIEYGVLEKRDISSLRWIIFGGSAMSSKHLNWLQIHYPDIQYSNAYGPAEVNAVTYHHLDPEPHPVDLAVPIGIACPNATMKVTDDSELLVATPAAMDRYWNQEALSQKAFCKIEGVKYYRTGDIVRCSDDGIYSFLGRKDRQVKVRGFRIELDEVEHALSSHHNVIEAAVVVAKDELSLVGYVTCRNDGSISGETLIAYVREILPAVSVPSRIEIIDAFDRTATGKINSIALGMETT